MSDSKRHSELAEIEEALGVLEKKHHPTWEIECVQATAVLRAHVEGLFEQHGALRVGLERIIRMEQEGYNEIQMAQEARRVLDA